MLYGPPGTGKTFSAMFLASQMPDRTVLMVTGRAVGLIEQVAVMARQLAPSTVVFEDVDLIAEDRRTTQNASATPVMFELLNAMDGLAEDADVLFVLTTNRPEVLEPALAARPGRVDQAIEIPLPDEDCRDRLISRYGEGMRLALTDRAAVIARTKGTSAAFIKELLRRSALIAADASPGSTSPEVHDGHVRDAMQEMLVDGGSMTRTLLGVGGVSG
ncbi:MAG: ATP-binding protein [Deltaproteobacteria bacterium]|nr:ATP-binding protein [Deltaproteobacteria bacterium]